MLTGRKLVFIGGDARQLEVIAMATELDASATLIGFDQLARSFTDTALSPLNDAVLAVADAVVLPVAGMDDDGRVDSKFSLQPILLTEQHFASLRPGTFVFSGIARPLLRHYCDQYELRLVKLMELDEVAILNSIPTAEGAIALAMENTDITIHGSQTAVLGFGRCGQTLARTLAGMGAKVRIGARQAAHMARIREMGLEAFGISEIAEYVGDAEIIFNTIPEVILSAAVLALLPKDVVVIDIASKPGGTDFRYAERHGMKAILAPSLPGLVAPRTAGQIIAKTLCRILADNAVHE